MLSYPNVLPRRGSAQQNTLLEESPLRLQESMGFMSATYKSFTTNLLAQVSQELAP